MSITRRGFLKLAVLGAGAAAKECGSESPQKNLDSWDERYSNPEMRRDKIGDAIDAAVDSVLADCGAQPMQKFPREQIRDVMTIVINHKICGEKISIPLNLAGVDYSNIFPETSKQITPNLQKHYNKYHGCGDIVRPPDNTIAKIQQ